MKILYFLFIIVLLNSCDEKTKEEPSVLFEQPQPVTAKDQRGFPKSIQGVYLNPHDSSTITINTTCIIKRQTEKAKPTRMEIDSTGKISNDSAIAFIKAFGFTTDRIKTDTFFISRLVTDTLFHITKDNVVRKLKGFYFLNTKVGDNGWEVERMEIQKKRFLKFSYIAIDDSLERYTPITAIDTVWNPADTTVNYFSLKPSKKELKKLIKEEAFKESETVYIKVR